MPRRKALLIGINYHGTSHELKGCINDAFNVREYLVQDRGFSAKEGDMVMLTDTPQNRGTPFEPTGANMMSAFHWLVTGNSPGDSVFISYSGHGGKLTFSQTRTRGSGEGCSNALTGQVRDPDGDRGSGYCSHSPILSICLLTSS